jgi:hypothetical protein
MLSAKPKTSVKYRPGNFYRPNPKMVLGSPTKAAFGTKDFHGKNEGIAKRRKE